MMSHKTARNSLKTTPDLAAKSSSKSSISNMPLFTHNRKGFDLLLLLLLFVSAAVPAVSGLDCSEKSLEEREEMANIVFTGTVRKIMVPDGGWGYQKDGTKPVYQSEIEIKRVFKGDDIVNKVANIVLDPIIPVRNHKMVMVDGFGDPHICANQVHISDTRIFLLTKGYNGELKLNSSILPVTLTNLEYTEAVVKNEKFTPVEEPKRSPCETYFCAFGAVCMVDMETSKPYCQCQNQCPGVFAPVCGSDNVTYSSDCLLEKSSCVQQKRVKVERPGVCGKRDPCHGKICKYGATCQPSLDGKEARCQCPSQCFRYGDNVGSKPVCGSDGKDYPNRCEMKKASCGQLVDIKVKYYGKCDPCEGVSCEPPEVCQVDSHREPRCQCKFMCFKDLQPVCGSDGKTYSNKCYLEMEGCKQHKNLQVLYNGECSAANNPCDQVQCRPMEECSVDRNGKPTCKCPHYCEPVVRYVCGNDSRTYDSECALRKKTCEANGPYVTVKHQGQCGEDVPCQNYVCDYGAICQVRNNRPQCVCPQCSEEYRPVCGQNGITYENECKLRQENCERQVKIGIRKRGACYGCGSLKCKFHAVCENDGDQPRCVCPSLSSCRRGDLPVCGSDSRTYSNECEMKVESCKREEIIIVASTGSCEKCRGVVCKFGAKCENGVCVCPILCSSMREAVCGSDGRTYINECEMRKSACTQEMDIEVAQDGECEGDDVIDVPSGSGSGDFDTEVEKDCNEEECGKYGGTCTVFDDGTFRCACNFFCDPIRKPVCGSDLRTYGSECQMRDEGCRKKQVLRMVSMDNCDEFEYDDACFGGKPMVNETTGEEYNCSSPKDPCPPGSICHITPTFAKCCKEENPSGKTCQQASFGCCKDGSTAALGPNSAGCPEYCNCNAVGSYGSGCDPVTRQCTCKPFVGGLRCDRCEIGYWGLHKIADDGNSGCIACNCNRMGSERDDCEQMTGRCMCKPLVSGMKCDRCSNGQRLGARGCDEWYQPTSCADMECQNGAVCQLRHDGSPECVCELSCDNSGNTRDIVCGTNNQNYGSECQLKMFACRLGQDIAVAYRGPCRALPPVRTTTSLPSTSRSRKTTRHIQGQTPDDETPMSSGTRKPDLDDETDLSQPEDTDDSCAGSYIDGLCLSDDQCCSNHSQCKLGLCHCRPGHVPSVDNRKCIAVKKKNQPVVTLPPEKDACANKPCYDGGRCQVDAMLGYRCICPLGRSGPLCNKQADFKTPSFNGRSYIGLPRIQKANQDLSIEVVFQTLNKDGIILFNSQNKDGTGDFVSLAVRDGFVEFRFDLGGGEAILRSRNQVEPGESHRVTARRVRSSGILIVDRDPDVMGNGPSTHVSLNLNDPLFVGFVPEVSKEIYERVGVDLGLVGCVHSLRAGSREEMYTYNLVYSNIDSDILNGADISECGSNPCKSMPCQNGGTCTLVDAEMYDCKCQAGYKGVLCDTLVDACASQPCQHGGTCTKVSTSKGFSCRCSEGREGTRCERESMAQVFVPQFTGSSYMEIPLDAAAIGKMMTIEIWFRPLQPNGVLFYAAQYKGGLGDFISLNLVKKRLQFKYFLGSGIASLQSKKTLHLDKWHKVVVSRDGRDGQMIINSHDPILGISPGSLAQLNLAHSLFIGGYSNRKDLPQESGITTGFTGAIQRVIINGQTVENLMRAAEKMSNITEYSGPPCNVNPCMNGGVCIPILNSAECRCPFNYMGQRCEKRADNVDKDQPVRFEGNTYLNYPSEVTRKQPAQRSNEISVRFKTTAENGLILFQNKGESVRQDYLALAVIRGRLEFTYNLGKQTEENLHILRSKVDVTDGQWHTARASRTLREGTLVVDNEIPVTKSSSEGSSQLDSDGELSVGGRSNLPWGLPQEYYQGFTGCIQRITVNGEQLHLVDHRNGHSSTIAFCS